jgi:hypothetical protein
MDRIAKYLFWTFVLVPTAFFGIVYLKGQEHASGAPQCSEESQAVRALERKVEAATGKPARIGRTIVERDGRFEMDLYDGLTPRRVVVNSDCSIVG